METIICQIRQMQIMKTVDIAELDITVILTIADQSEKIEPCHEKINVLVSDKVRHKPGCTAIEESKRLEFSDLGSRWIVLPM